MKQSTLNVEKEADGYFNRYKPQMQLLETYSPLSKIRSIGAYDHYALGKQLEAFEVYKSICEDDGTVAQLGKIPDVAFDIITVNYGSSPISAIASVQPV